MNRQTSDSETDKYTAEDFAAAFAIAREALAFVGKFHTPPTPEVYELWYRYVQGNDELLNQRMSFLVNESKSASRAQMEMLEKEFLERPSPEVFHDAAERLIQSMSGFESMIQSQKEVGFQFDTSLKETNRKLESRIPTPEEFQVCVSEVLESNESMQKQLEEMGVRLDESHREMQQLKVNLSKSRMMLLTDPLTGVGNRRYFDAMIKQTLAKPPEQPRMMLLMLIDLDNFKDVNDKFGHDSGDAVIQFMAGQLTLLAGSSSIARYGGDEFAIFSVVDNHEVGKELAEMIVETISRKSLTLNRTGQVVGRLGISIGGGFLRNDDTENSWFQRADKLLYAAKSSGRNRSMVERKI